MMYCPKCGTSHKDDDRFCKKCGTELQKTPKTSVIPPWMKIVMVLVICLYIYIMLFFTKMIPCTRLELSESLFSPAKIRWTLCSLPRSLDVDYNILGFKNNLWTMILFNILFFAFSLLISIKVVQVSNRIFEPILARKTKSGKLVKEKTK